MSTFGKWAKSGAFLALALALDRLRVARWNRYLTPCRVGK